MKGRRGSDGRGKMGIFSFFVDTLHVRVRRIFSSTRTLLTGESAFLYQEVVRIEDFEFASWSACVCTQRESCVGRQRTEDTRAGISMRREKERERTVVFSVLIEPPVCVLYRQAAVRMSIKVDE